MSTDLKYHPRKGEQFHVYRDGGEEGAYEIWTVDFLDRNYAQAFRIFGGEVVTRFVRLHTDGTGLMDGKGVRVVFPGEEQARKLARADETLARCLVEFAAPSPSVKSFAPDGDLSAFVLGYRLALTRVIFMLRTGMDPNNELSEWGIHRDVLFDDNGLPTPYAE